MKILTYEEWCEYMIPKVEWKGKIYHNYGITKDLKIYIEDWVEGKRIFITESEDVSVCVPIDPRFIPIGHRQYSNEIYPEYLAIGADKWKFPNFLEKYNNPPPPL